MPRQFKDKRKDKREMKERFWKKKVCRFCKDDKLRIDYKDGRALTAFTTERGKIMARRITGNCSYHQRKLTLAIKRARLLALLPYAATQARW